MARGPARSGGDAILRRIERHRDAVRRYGVKSLGLFGSAARGQARKGSDLDFVVELERKTFDDYMGLKLYLEDLFGKRIDLVLTEAIKPSLREAILSEARYAKRL